MKARLSCAGGAKVEPKREYLQIMPNKRERVNDLTKKFYIFRLQLCEVHLAS
jgi:hypothetical protein